MTASSARGPSDRGTSARGPGYSVVIAGGGTRTFWALAWLRALNLEGTAHGAPRAYAGTSAGATMAMLAASGRAEVARAYFFAAAGRNPRNFYPEALLRRSGAAFPHETIYRATLSAALADGGLAALRAGPPVRALLACVEPGEPALRRGLMALWQYEARKRRGELLAPPGVPVGLGERVVTLQEAPDERQVIDWLIASSATWPVTAFPRFDGRLWVDGGLVDNVPVRALRPEERGRVLVLLSRPYPRLPERPGLLFVVPSRPVPVKKWDYTSPGGLEATAAQGERDAEVDRDRVLRFLEG